MADPSSELQSLIWQTLTDDLNVTCPVYDKVPEDASKPYISFGPENWIPDDTGCRLGILISCQIDFWTDSPGRDEIKPIVWAAYEALHGTDLALVEHQYEMGRVVSVDIERDDDGLTTHGRLLVNFSVGAI